MLKLDRKVGRESNVVEKKLKKFSRSVGAFARQEVSGRRRNQRGRQIGATISRKAAELLHV